ADQLSYATRLAARNARRLLIFRRVTTINFSFRHRWMI
ncbi:MAG: hypothetical protein ACI8W7_003700, partial [Gammaproteobacteria bacterium]